MLIDYYFRTFDDMTQPRNYVHPLEGCGRLDTRGNQRVGRDAREIPRRYYHFLLPK
jgi:hypothetical protein